MKVSSRMFFRLTELALMSNGNLNLSSQKNIIRARCSIIGGKAVVD